MTPEQRISLTRYIWTSLLLTIATIVFFSARSPSIGGMMIPIIIFLIAGAVPITGFVLNWGSGSLNESSESSEKSKRQEQLDEILERLNDKELEALRQRLAYEDEPYSVGEDGELMYMEKH